APATFPLGSTTVTWTVTDGSGNTATDTQLVTVVDTQAPIVSNCPSNITVNNDSGANSAVVTWVEPTANDNCSGLLTYDTRSHAPGSTFPVGSTEVTYTFTDASSNTTTCTFTVTVVDNEPPVLTCPGTITVQCIGEVPAAYATLIDFTAAGGSATDNVGVIATSFTLIDQYSDGGVCPETITRVYAIGDNAGNVSNCTQSIVIDDTTPPALTGTIPDGATGMVLYFADIPTGPTEAEIAAQYTDNCSGAVTATKSGTPTGNDDSWTVTYTYLVQDACGNSVVPSPTVTYSGGVTGLGINIDAINNVLCFGEATGSVMITVSGGITPYSYSWKNSLSVEVSTSQDLVNVVADNYTITVTDKEGKIATQTVSITQPASSVNFTTSVVQACYGESTGSITVNGVGGTSPYTYSIQGGAYTATNVFTGLAAGTYLISVKDDNGCTVSDYVSVTQPMYKVAGTTQINENILCYGERTGSVTINATGGTGVYTYSIDGGSTYVANNTFTGLRADSTYTAFVRDSNGCLSNPITVLLSQPTKVVATLKPYSEIQCNGGYTNVEITVSGGYQPYSYKLDGGAPSNIGIFTVAAGTHTVVVRDYYFCTDTITFTVGQPTALTLSIVSQTNIVCSGETGSVTVQATGGVGSYQYKIDGGTYSDVSVFSGLAAGSHQVTVMDANNCLQSIPVNITTIPFLTGNIIGSPINVSCNGGDNGSITVRGSDGTPPYRYRATTDGTGAYSSEVAAGDDYIISGLSAGIYTVSIRDANNCLFTFPSTIEITEPDALVVTSAAVTTPIFCSGGTGTVTIVASGGTSPYSYTFNGETNDTGVFTGVLAGLSRDYSVTDANLCGPVTGSIDVAEPEVLAVTSAAVTTPIVCNGGTGTVTIVATGGTAPYSYTFNGETNSTGIFTGVLAGLSQGYSVTDANLCGPVTGSIDVAEPEVLAVTSATVTTPIVCNGGTGTVTIVATGGTAPYSYTFNGETNSTGIFTGVLAGLSQGYSVTDANLCGPVTGSIDVAEPEVLAVTSATVTTPIVCNGGTGTVTIVATGGTAPYSYTFNGETNSTGVFTGVLAGLSRDYSVTDANGCGPVTGSIDVAEPEVLAVTSATVTTPIACNGGTGTVTIVASGGTAPYSYTFNGETNATGIFTGVSAGPSQGYSVTDANLCGPVIGTIDVVEPGVISVVLATVTTPIVCNGGTGTVTIVATGGTAPYSYTFNGETNDTGIFTGVSAGLSRGYSVTDQNGCGPVTGSIDVAEPEVLAVTSAAVTTPISCNGGTGTVTIVATGGTAPYSYTFNGETNDTGIFTGVSTGPSQGYSVTDANLCGPVTGSIDVAEPEVLAVTSATVTTPIVCNGGTGTVTIVATGGTAPYSYTFNGETNDTGIFTGVSAGPSQGYSVTDQNGCGPVTGSIDVAEPEVLAVTSATVTTPIVCNGGTGTVTIVATGGTAPYSYTFNGETNDTGIFTGVSAGPSQGYSVTDQNGCGPVTGSIDVAE
ncbi:MAG: beta strand repeat-containing protein, partial [Bacteroidales bacterium]